MSRLSTQCGVFVLLGCPWAVMAEVPSLNLIDATYGIGVGSFELGDYDPSTENGRNYFNQIPPGSQRILGWSVGGDGDGVDWLSTTAFLPHSGAKALDLRHVESGSIQTEFETKAGSEYLLSFAAASLVGKSSAGSVAVSSREVELLSLTFDSNPSDSYRTLSYGLFRFPFTAQSDITTLAFAAAGLTSDAGAIIDTVSVELILDEKLGTGCLDIDLLSQAILQGSTRVRYDVNGDDNVDASDRTAWMGLAHTTSGDVDLDGRVAFSDFLLLSSHYGGFGGWCQGDTDGDAVVGFGDFLELSSHFGEFAMTSVANVAEPQTTGFTWLLVLTGYSRRWLRSLLLFHA